MASSHHHAPFVAGGVAQEFGVRLDAKAQSLGFDEFRIVLSGVHAQDDEVQIRGDSRWVPALCFGEKPSPIEPAPGRFKNLVVAASDVVSRGVQRQRKVVHGAAAHGDEMNSHGWKFKSFRMLRAATCAHLPTFAP